MYNEISHLVYAATGMPSSVYDAKGLMKAAIRDNNPVIFFEHKYLYRRAKAPIPDDDYIVPLGTANVVMGDDGRRTADANLCVHSDDAVEIVERNALRIARDLPPTTNRYFLWGDDGKPWNRPGVWLCSPLVERSYQTIRRFR